MLFHNDEWQQSSYESTDNSSAGPIELLLAAVVAVMATAVMPMAPAICLAPVRDRLRRRAGYRRFGPLRAW
jgi:hypothetical protein